MTGRTERGPAAEVEALIVPERVELSHDRLLWVVKPADRAGRVEVPRGLLDRFLALRSPAWPGRADSPMASRGGDPGRFRLLPHAAVAAVAAQYGVLAVCRHGLPTTHAVTSGNPIWFGRAAFPQVTDCLPLGALDDGFQRSMAEDWTPVDPTSLAGWEPVSYWRQTARMLYSVLRIHGSVHDPSDDAQRLAWSHLATWPPSVLSQDILEGEAALTDLGEEEAMQPSPSRLDEGRRTRPSTWPWSVAPSADWDLDTREELYRQRYRAAQVMPTLDEGQIPAQATWRTSAPIADVLLHRYVEGLLALAAPRLTYRPERTRSAVLTTNGLFGALVLQLLLRLHGSTGFAICSGCGQIYTPWRRPAADSPAYCTDCRVADGNAVRQRRLRAKLRLGAVGTGQRPLSPRGGSGPG